MQTDKMRNLSEQRLKARTVSRGVAIGKIVCLYGKNRQFYRIAIKSNQVEREIKRFRAAVRLSKKQLIKLCHPNKNSISDTQANIFEAHLLVLEDNSLLSKIEEGIRQQLVNAEWSVKTELDRYISIFKDFDDETLRERRFDLQDVMNRLLGALGGGERSRLLLEKDSIIVASEVNPSTLVELSQNNLRAIITENGGWTSHTFILARELGLPAVTGVKGVLRRLKTGENVIVDGLRGQVFLHPTIETIGQYQKRATQRTIVPGDGQIVPKGKLTTLDGRHISIRVNLDIADGYAKARRFGTEGIGLFRSEFLLTQFQDMPTEKQQYEAYCKIADLAGDDGVRIRTFDISMSQLNDEAFHYEKNPSLGLRAIRLCLSHEKLFRTQLRALLRASADRKLDIILPMISDISEILRAKEIIEEEKTKLQRKKNRFGHPKIGVMIEVPSAVLVVEEIAAEVDFLSVGTNDLVQYLLAVDRDNELVAEWFHTLHPAVIRSLRMIVDAADSHQIPVIVCGEMAGSHLYMPILIGLGFTELSMNVNAMPKIRQIIANIAFEEAADIVKSLTTCKTASQVETIVREGLIAKWSHLFADDPLVSGR